MLYTRGRRWVLLVKILSELTGRGITASRTVGNPRGTVLHKDDDFVVFKMSNTVSELSILVPFFFCHSVVNEMQHPSFIKDSE
jgi:hypothetical protein